jgi:hypothetical protein
MQYQNKVVDRYCNSLLESEPLQKYWEEKGGLLFTEFNTTYGQNGILRALDAIRFPDLDKGAYRSKGNYEAIGHLIKSNEVELIEVHGWGLYGFGQIVGKSEIVQKHWTPKRVTKVIITINPKFDPKKNPDTATREVFEKYGIKIFIP